MKLSQVIRYCAIFDLLVTGLFAFPGLAQITMDVLVAINNTALTPYEMPTLPALAWLFINLMGALGMVWALGRIFQPSASLARVDALARLVVAGLLVYYLSYTAVPAILWVFVITEVLGSLWQFRTLRRNRGLVNPY